MAATTSKFLLFILVAMTALGPMSMQIFLPALPAIRSGYGVSAAMAQLTLSVSMLAIALATLIYGPLSDRYGRRPVVILGLACFLGGSALCAAAPEIWTLIAGRMLQGAGGASGMVLARAIVRDLYSRERSASVIAYLTTAMVIAPMVSPTIGGALTDWISWRASFVTAGLIGMIVMAMAVTRLPETHTERDPIEGLKSFFGGFGPLLARPIFCGYTLNAAFILSTFFSFMSGAPYVMVDVLERPATEYGLYFMMAAGGFMAGGLTAGRVSERVGIDRMIVIGSFGSLVAAGLSFTLMASGLWHPLALFGPTTLGSFSAGLAIPNAQAGAVSVNPRAAGAASGLAGFIQMFIGAGVAQAVGMIQDGTPYPMLGMMLACAALALAAIVLPLWYHRRAAGTEAT
jgi:DHA1 family bicyclomycin/chloramphenicol resistance-like MFS transporter